MEYKCINGRDEKQSSETVRMAMNIHWTLMDVAKMQNGLLTIHSGLILTNTVKTKPGHYVQQLWYMLLAISV